MSFVAPPLGFVAGLAVIAFSAWGARSSLTEAPIPHGDRIVEAKAVSTDVRWCLEGSEAKNEELGP